MKTVCFTGHRPNKLGGYNWNSEKNILIRKCIKNEIVNLLRKYPNEDFHFICGGALGFDQFATEGILTLRRDYKITLEIAIPFKNQPNKWFDKSDINRYYKQLELADKITYVDKLPNYKIKGLKEDEYSALKLNIRNNYMVDNSDIVIAYWDGSKSGTGNCINYAKRKGKEIINLYKKDDVIITLLHNIKPCCGIEMIIEETNNINDYIMDEKEALYIKEEINEKNNEYMNKIRKGTE